MAARLLPTNASELERLAAEAFAQIERVPVPLRDLWNPDACPVELLPILAWSFSVDRWSQAWPESAKRNAIKAAYFIHAHKGTIGALRRVVEPMGFALRVDEWWQLPEPGIPGTFTATLESSGMALDGPTLEATAALLDDAKPVSRHLTNLAHRLSETGELHIASALVTGETTTVIPLIATDHASHGALYSAAGMATGEITTIYPLGAFT